MGYVLVVVGATMVCSVLGLSGWDGFFFALGLGLFHVGMAWPAGRS